jgi:hypothetical protein
VVKTHTENPCGFIRYSRIENIEVPTKWQRYKVIVSAPCIPKLLIVNGRADSPCCNGFASLNIPFERRNTSNEISCMDVKNSYRVWQSCLLMRWTRIYYLDSKKQRTEKKIKKVLQNGALTYNCPFMWAIRDFCGSLSSLSVVQENLWIRSDTGKQIAWKGKFNILNEFCVSFDELCPVKSTLHLSWKSELSDYTLSNLNGIPFSNVRKREESQDKTCLDGKRLYYHLQRWQL